MKKRELERCIEIVRASVHRIDPHCLLESGSPTDEFDSEIMSIAAQLPRCSSGRDVAHSIARVLNSSLSQSYKPEEFATEGSIIFEALVEIGIK